MSRRTRREAAAREQRLLTDLEEAQALAESRLRDLGRKCAEVSDLRDENNELHRALTEATIPDPRWLAERRRLQQRVLAAERRAAELDARLVQLQADNEHLCQDAVDRAGTLAGARP